MSRDEIQELLDLKGWTRTRLASEMRLTENAVQRWFMAGEAPDGPPSILLRIWLSEARQSGNGHKRKLVRQ
jgi:transcriptional regulator with XRE-family HTH domain